MRIFKNKEFHRWASQENIKDEMLVKAVQEMSRGLYEANLGGGVYKKRLPIMGRGKSGGARVIVAFKIKSMAVFMYGFSKKRKENITIKEKEALKMLAKVYFIQLDNQIEKAIKEGKLIEVAK